MKTEEIYRDFDNKLFKLEIKLGELCDNKYKVSYKDIFEEITNVRLDIRNQMNLCASPEDSGHSFTEGMKITPERAKEIEDIMPCLCVYCPECNGVLAATALRSDWPITLTFYNDLCEWIREGAKIDCRNSSNVILKGCKCTPKKL